MSGVKQVAALVDKDGNYYDALNPLPTTGRGRCYPHHDASHLLTDSVQSHNKRRTGMGRYHIDNGDGTGQLRCGGPLDAVSDGGNITESKRFTLEPGESISYIVTGSGTPKVRIGAAGYEIR